jgi:hypothetical protein
MLDWLYAFNPAAPYVLGVAAVWVAAELGRWIGARWRRMHTEACTSADLAILEEGALALLALIVGFTFSMTLQRYDNRIRGTVLEANAIGTTALRARLLPEPHATEMRRLLHDYVAVRLELARDTPGAAALGRTLAHSNQLQEAMWRHAVETSAGDSRSVPVGLFVRALNDMIDSQGVRVAAARDRVPIPTVVMLYGITLVVIGFSGYIGGSGAKRGRVPVVLVGGLVAVVIGMVGDFDRPRTGFVHVSQQPLADVSAGLNVGQP